MTNISISNSVVLLTIIAVLLKIGDVFTTTIAVATYGIDVEINPLVKYLMECIGVMNGLFLTWLLFAAAIIWGVKNMPQKNKWWCPGIACVMYIPVVANNVYQLVR